MKLLILLILILAATLRFYGLNWDQGFHLHPDERMITMVAEKIKWPASESDWDNLFTSQSTLNPKFFAYGSLPIYLLKIASALPASFDPSYGRYENLNLVGRVLSVFFDLGSILVLFLLSKKIFNLSIATLAALFYAVSTLPIQLSHFYAVDTTLNFFILVTLYRLIVFYQKTTFKNALLVGIFLGASLATKISATVLLISILIAILADFLAILFKHHYHFNHWLPHLSQSMKKLILYGGVMIFSTIFTFIIFEPFALIDFAYFWQQIKEQNQMTKNAFVFPYTLQYIGKIPYWYELKNIFFYGLGSILAISSLIGLIYLTYLSIFKEKSLGWAKELIIISFFWAYFITVGSFAIGFMRYMLPAYPILCLGAALFIFHLFKSIHLHFKISPLILYSCLPAGTALFLILILIWPLSFMAVYSRPNTRLQASEWIYQNIAPGSTIAREHWDDGLPLLLPNPAINSGYTIFELELYNPENALKWSRINQALQRSDYIIIASHRLYVPLQQLTNCQLLPSHRCYPLTAAYYQKLFNGELGFVKIAEFNSLPTVPIINYPINDFGADESFTVYDHPKIMIFKKETLNENRL